MGTVYRLGLIVVGMAIYENAKEPVSNAFSWVGDKFSSDGKKKKKGRFK